MAGLQRAMGLLQRLPAVLRAPLMRAGMAAMQNPPEAVNRFALLLLPLNVWLAYLPHFCLRLPVLLSTGKFDNTAQRSDAQKDLQTRHPQGRLLARAKAAHMNSLEMLPVFCAAVLACVGRSAHAGMQARLKVAKLALAYTVGRALYIVLYLCGVNEAVAACRTAAWAANLWTCHRLFMHAVKAPLRGSD